MFSVHILIFLLIFLLICSLCCIFASLVGDVAYVEMIEASDGKPRGTAYVLCNVCYIKIMHDFLVPFPLKSS